ncbi:hypothetical protein CDAR_206411 [Caerostris darwini]|uniref:Uncharacterized protein n=1 Tax=Caerostris darwini TaxID=1538125 RepID=A0AAV4RMT3_9ARAC|nr:hypothetical protein CDAR_206411 [Caerostris darwini]
MRFHYLSPKKSPKHLLPVIICHATALRQRGMGLRKLRLINRQPPPKNLKSGAFPKLYGYRFCIKSFWRGKVALVGSDGCLLKEIQQLSVIDFVDMFDLPPTASGFGISPVNGMFFN